MILQKMLCLYVCIKVKPIIIALLLISHILRSVSIACILLVLICVQNSITMPYLAVAQLMHVIKWPRSDSDGSCMNKNGHGNKGFYSIASISPISLHIQVEVRLYCPPCLVNHLCPDHGLAGISSFTKRKLFHLPLTSKPSKTGNRLTPLGLLLS